MQNRDVVFCLRYERTLWSRDEQIALTGNAYRVRDINAYLLGRARVYTATWSPPHGKYVLEAYQWRQGGRLYESAVLPSNWAQVNFPAQWEPLDIQHSKLMRPTNGRELILQINTDPNQYASGFGVDIIRGLDGHLIRTIPFTGAVLPGIPIHLPTKQAVILEKLSELPPELAGYSVIIMHRFFYDRQRGFPSSCADALLIHGNVYKIPQHQNLLQIDPFRMAFFLPTGLGCKHRYAGAIGSRAIIPTDDQPLCEAVQAAVETDYRQTRIPRGSGNAIPSRR
ncbi:hypothetical protein BDW62DRAFT_145238 [Aspergillus aurantiobrunneus]